MAVNLSAPDPKTIFPVAGVELGTTMASIRKANRRDMMVMRFTRVRTRQASLRRIALRRLLCRCAALIRP